VDTKIAVYVTRTKLAENGDYNLSGDRYRITTDYSNAKWPMVAIEELCELGRGRVISKKDIELNPGPFPVFSSQTTDNGTFGYLGTYDFDGEYVTWTTDGANAGTVFYRSGKFNCTNVCGTLRAKSTNINMHFLANALNVIAYKYVIQVGNPKLMNGVVAKIKIPLPPLEIQEQVVAELDSYAGIIAGAKQIAHNWKPKIDIDPEWEKVVLNTICDVRDGTHDSPKYKEVGYPLITSKNIINGAIDFDNVNLISEEDLKAINKRSFVDDGDIIMPMIGTIGNPIIVKKDREFAVKNVALIKFYQDSKIDRQFLKNILDSDYYSEFYKQQASGSTQKFISLGFIRSIKIPLPPLSIQKQIVAQIEAERVLVESAKKLIAVYEAKTKAALAKLWAEDTPTTKQALAVAAEASVTYKKNKI
jgi:type I restriction enzyme M protein